MIHYSSSKVVLLVSSSVFASCSVKILREESRGFSLEASQSIINSVKDSCLPMVFVSSWPGIDWPLPVYLIHFRHCIFCRWDIFWVESFQCWLFYLFLQVHSYLDTGIDLFMLHMSMKRAIQIATSLL